MKTVTPTPIQIDEEVIHVDPHLDEIEARREVHKYGGKHLSGNKNSRLRFSRDLPALGDDHFDNEKILPYGCGGGRFDEHNKGQDGGRLPDQCCTTLVAEYLGIRSSVIKPLIDEVLFCDQRSGVLDTQLASLVKVAHRSLPGSNQKVVNWASTALDAVDRQLTYKYESVASQSSLLQFLEALEKHDPTRYGSDPRARKSLETKLRRSMGRTDKLTDLANIVRCFYSTAVLEGADITEWVWFAFDRIFDDQILFWQAIDDCQSKDKIDPEALPRPVREYVEALVDNRGTMDLRMILLHSDNPHAASAARHEKGAGAEIVFIRKSTGHIAVFVNQNLRLTVSNVVRMLRFLELPKRGEDWQTDPRNRQSTVAFEWAELGKPGDFSNSNIHYFKAQDGESVLNGSATRPGILPSEVCSEALLEIARTGFHPRSIGRWMAEHGIQRSERRPGNDGNGQIKPVNPSVSKEVETALDKAVAK